MAAKRICKTFPESSWRQQVTIHDETDDSDDSSDYDDGIDALMSSGDILYLVSVLEQVVQEQRQNDKVANSLGKDTLLLLPLRNLADSLFQCRFELLDDLERTKK